MLASVAALHGIRERLRLSLWFLPGCFAVGAVLLAVLLVAIDERLTEEAGIPFAFGGSAEGARNVLSAIAQSMLTFTGLVFSITMLVLQLASSQLSPRVMRTFLRDRANQVVLGLFVATFVYTLVVLREVRAPGEAQDAFVPGVSVWVAFTLLLASVGAFIYYIDHMAHAIRSTTVIRRIADETVEAIEGSWEMDEGGGSEDGAWSSGPMPTEVGASRAGLITGYDDAALLELAETRGMRLDVLPAVGSFVPLGAPLARSDAPSLGEADIAAVRDAIHLGDERSLEQDPGFGLRQLVDIALRALSPGVNDPSTAVEALDRIHDLLRRLAVRRPPPSVLRAGDGRPLVHLPRPTWAALLQLGTEEIRRAGPDQVQVVRRLHVLATDLATLLPEGRLAPVRTLLSELDETGRDLVDAAPGAGARP